MCERVRDQRVGYLEGLRSELLAVGVKCELDAGPIPRLRLNIPWGYHSADDAFQDNVVVSAEPDGIWRFWWPWVQSIAPAGDMAAAVAHIRRSAEVWDDDNLAGDNP